MKSILFAAGAALLLAAPAAHAANPALEAPLHQFLDSFNKGDAKGARASHVAAPSIIDEIGPHAWSGPGAFDRWSRDLDKDAKIRGITDQSVTLGAPTREVISGSKAYVITPATYAYKQKGVPMREVAQMTFALTKVGAGWKISAWTWTGPDPSPVK